jgi:hypothetical protein
VIGNDLEFLAEKAVDTKRANYAVITGVQVHNWATELTPESGVPSLEFVAWDKCYVVVDGQKIYLDLNKVREGGRSDRPPLVFVQAVCTLI